jgi:uncharacterized delta-60 repeat protein
LHDGGSLSIEGSLFEGNSAQGGDGMDLGSSYQPVFGDAKGGAVFNYSGSLELRNSTLMNNQAIGGTVVPTCGTCYFGAFAGQGLGGAVYNEGTLHIANCTAVGNAANGGQGAWHNDWGGWATGGPGYGGAIFNGSNTLSLLNVTLAANSVQGGADAYSGVAPASGASLALAAGTVTLTNSIISCLPGQTNVYGTVGDGGHNISSDASAAFTAEGSSNSVDPTLGPLADNGGATPTMALLPGSPALDSGDDLAAPPTDQRGVGRPCGAHSDIGAVEQIVSEPLKFTWSPHSQTLFAGQTASFYVAVNDLASYQWQFEGKALAGATNTLLILPDLQPSQAGNYAVLATTASGSITSSPAMLTILPPAPPVILSQPQNQMVPEGQPVSFSVVATNPLAITYQWQHNGTNLPGATQSVLTFDITRSEDAGKYTVVVSTKYLSMTSSQAVLAIVSSPVIVTQPADAAVTEGETAAISVVAQGRAPLAYSWQFEGVDLPGMVGPTLTLTKVSITQAGTYRVSVSNAVGHVSCEPVVLMVKSSALDRGFAPAILQAGSVLVQKDGKPIIGQVQWSLQWLIRLNDDGTVDGTFMWPPGYAAAYPALRSDDRIVANVLSPGGSWVLVLANQDGSIDSSFSADPTVPASAVTLLAVQPDGKVVVYVGYQTRMLVRFNQDGSRDTTFTPALTLDYNHDIHNLLSLPKGKLLLCQDDPDLGQRVLVRLSAEGVREFALPLGGSVYAWATQADGKVLVGGSFVAISGTSVTNLARLNPDGSIDSTFKPTLSTEVTGVAPVDSGDTYVGIANGLLRLRADGSVDPTFEVTTSGGAVQTIANIGGGRLLISGGFDYVDGIARPGLARLIVPTSVPRITDWIRIGPMARFSVPTLPNKTYTIERSQSMAPNSWAAVETITGDGSKRVLVDRNATDTEAFYRVRLDE